MTLAEPSRTVTRLADGAELPAAGRWRIDPGHTELAFVGRHFMLTKVRGRFTGLSGVIQVAEDPGDTTVEVTIDMTDLGRVRQPGTRRAPPLRGFLRRRPASAGQLLRARGRLARHARATHRAADPARGHPAGHPAGRVPRLRRRPLGRSPRRLHRRRHP